MRLWRGVLLLSIVSSFPMTAFASEARQHDSGFFLRLAPGFGSFGTKVEDSGDSVKFSGTSGAFDVAIGAVVKPNLALHATLGGWAAVDPEVELNGVGFPSEDLTVGLSVVGVGATYYLGESNVYVTGTLGLAAVNAEFDGEEAETGTGVAVEVGVGKEWWVSDKIGLGVSGTLGFHSVPAEDLDARFKGTAFGIRLSATFN